MGLLRVFLVNDGTCELTARESRVFVRMIDSTAQIAGMMDFAMQRARNADENEAINGVINAAWTGSGAGE